MKTSDNVPQSTDPTVVHDDVSASSEQDRASRRQLLGGVASLAVSAWVVSVASFIDGAKLSPAILRDKGALANDPILAINCMSETCGTRNCDTLSCSHDLSCSTFNCGNNFCYVLDGGTCNHRAGDCPNNSISCTVETMCTPNMCGAEGPLVGPSFAAAAVPNGASTLPYARSLALRKG